MNRIKISFPSFKRENGTKDRCTATLQNLHIILTEHAVGCLFSNQSLTWSNTTKLDRSIGCRAPIVCNHLSLEASSRNLCESMTKMLFKSIA